MSATVAMLVTDAQKLAVETAVNELTPEYTIGFIRKIAALDPAITWETPQTHWYLNAQSVPDIVVAAWQTFAATATGLILFIAVNADNPLEWAYSNLASQGLQFVPDPPL